MKVKFEMSYVKDGKLMTTNDVDVLEKEFKEFENIDKLKKGLLEINSYISSFEKLELSKMSKKELMNSPFISENSRYIKSRQNIGMNYKLSTSTKFNRIYEHVNLGGNVLASWSGFTAFTMLPNAYKDRASSVLTEYDMNLIGLWQCRKIKVLWWTFYIPIRVQFVHVSSVGNTTAHFWNAPEKFSNDVVDAYSSLR